MPNEHGRNATARDDKLAFCVKFFKPFRFSPSYMYVLVRVRPQGSANEHGRNTIARDAKLAFCGRFLNLSGFHPPICMC